MLNQNQPAPLSAQKTSISLANWFDPDQIPVTLAVDAFAGKAWDQTRSRLEEACAGDSPVTVCVASGITSDEKDRLAAALAESGLDRSRVCLVTAGSICPEVLPRTPLLAPEYACVPWSKRQLMCPAETAWVPLELSLLPFAKDLAGLGTALDALVDLAEVTHDVARWPTAKMQRDACLNRRIALELLDIGRYAVGRSSSEMHRCLGWISARLQARSSYWARHRKPLPSISVADPSRNMPPSPMREQWRLRWRRAVAAHAVRHRNLLVLSPWSIVDAALPQRFELLSLLVHADAICLAPPCHTAAPGESERRAVEQRLRVALQQRQALDQIAKHI